MGELLCRVMEAWVVQGASLRPLVSEMKALWDSHTESYGPLVKEDLRTFFAVQLFQQGSSSNPPPSMQRPGWVGLLITQHCIVPSQSPGCSSCLLPPVHPWWM